MLIETLRTVSSADWDRIYARDASASPSQSRRWADIITDSSRVKDCSRLYKFADGNEVVLPLFVNTTFPRILSVYRSPPPAWGFGGLISTAPLNSEHIRLVLEDCTKLPCAAVQIRPNPLQADAWFRAATGTAWEPLARNAHIIDLRGGFDDVWMHQFPGRTRTKIRKSRKSEVTVESGGCARLVEEFDILFRTSITRWAKKQNEVKWLAAFRGRLRDPEKKFKKMAHDAGGLLRVYIARIEEKPVAGIIVLLDGNGHYTRGAMDADLIGHSNANYLLQSVAIEDACALNCQHYNMGETGSSVALAKFKTRFGAVAVPYAEYRFERVPILSAEQKLRAVVKKLIGFQDA
ncbi:GNAT family N-acetyltransferase [Pseudopelagicola sp. nBUS_19]|uniref:GNAT family N-acetyltransferase n=1 Tax=unclassified Pseudopelagicola TaxID=2649563 RepID=UPI003EBB22D8